MGSSTEMPLINGHIKITDISIIHSLWRNQRSYLWVCWRTKISINTALFSEHASRQVVNSALNFIRLHNGCLPYHFSVFSCFAFYHCFCFSDFHMLNKLTTSTASLYFLVLHYCSIQPKKAYYIKFCWNKLSASLLYKQQLMRMLQ